MAAAVPPVSVGIDQPPEPLPTPPAIVTFAPLARFLAVEQERARRWLRPFRATSLLLPVGISHGPA